jgi:hypothetical protein
MKKSLLVAMAACAVLTIATVGYLPSAVAQQAALSTAGGVITLKGTENQTSPTVKISGGVYVVRRVAGEGFMSITVKDPADNILHATFFNDPNGTYLLIVDGNPIKPGDVLFEIMGMGAWTVTVTKVEASGGVALPQVLSGAEMTDAVSQPFKAAAGDLVMSYTYKNTPKGTGTLTICDVVTGKNLPMREMMYAGKISGGWNVQVPAAGVYIASASFPLASGGGEVKLSQ